MIKVISFNEMGSAHILPLSKQSVEILKEYSGHERYLFRSVRTPHTNK